MKQEQLDRLQAIQDEQFEALSLKQMDHLQALETEKTRLLHGLGDLKGLTPEQQQQLKVCLDRQTELERVCTEIRDALGDQLKQEMHRQKAVQAYKDSGY